MTEQVPLIVAGFSARAAAQAARRSGFAPIAVDFCQDRDLIANCQWTLPMSEPEWLTLLSARFPNVPYLLTGGMEHRADVADVLNENANGCGCTGSQIQSMRSCNHWQGWANACCISFPDSFGIGQSAIPKQLTGRWLLKSIDSAGGTNIEEMATNDLACVDKHFFERFPNRYLQRWMPGQTLGVTFLSTDYGSCALGAAIQMGETVQMHMPKFQYRGSYGPTPVAGHMQRSLDRFADTVGSETHFLGLWQADFLLHESELTLLEINPRWSASMELLDVSYELNMVDLHYRSICHTLSSERWQTLVASSNSSLRLQPKRSIGKLVMYAQRELTVSQKQSDQWWGERWTGGKSINASPIEFADIPNAGLTFECGQPIVSCFAEGDDVRRVLETLQAGMGLQD